MWLAHMHSVKSPIGLNQFLGKENGVVVMKIGMYSLSFVTYMMSKEPLNPWLDTLHDLTCKQQPFDN